MNNNNIVQKLWNLCNVLRDDGITYHEYVTELTYILFLKMANSKEIEEKIKIPFHYRWDELIKLDGIELAQTYRKALLEFSEKQDELGTIYHNAQTKIEEPRNLKKIFSEMNKMDFWDSELKDNMGDLYEGLLEKNAEEKKSGAGQYFTPRVLIDSIVKLTEPKLGERIFDPAGGTLGFLISAYNYLKKTNDMDDLSDDDYDKLRDDTFFAMELVPDTHRLAVMNALLHDIKGKIENGNTLSSKGETMKNFDLILSNPPFGSKKGGEGISRTDLVYQTSNKQLNFLQVIYNSLAKTGKARAAVVLPDNVLFESGTGADIRKDLMNKCNLHTILRLPTGIFYAQGVKTNVLFFDRGTTEIDNTKEVWFYDMRTNQKNFNKSNPLKASHFEEFENSYNSAEEKEKLKEWNKFTIEEIAKKEYSLDLGLIKDDSVIDHEDLPNPIESADDAITKLEEAVDLLRGVIKELHICGVEE